MQYNTLGRTGLRISALGFGCGSVGGILVRGDYPTMRQVVARAIELGINYFDTAPLYGNGQSEVNLGAVLRELGADVIVGTKVRPVGEDMERLGIAVALSVESSLRRLGRDYIDLIQVHNHLGRERRPESDQLAVRDLEDMQRAFERLQMQGKVRYWGLTGQGETQALHDAVTTGAFQSIQVPYNLLNPSAGMAVPPDFPYQDFGQLIRICQQRRVGVIAIRVLAGGALSGTLERHPVASPSVNPIASEQTYEADVARTQRYDFLVKEGIVSNLVEAAVRFVIGTPGVSTALIGISSQEQLEQAVRFAEKGPLPAEALSRIP